MKQKTFVLLFVLFLISFSRLLSEETSGNPLKHAVTYSFSGGRFGDNLLSYFHAKWVSYKYGIKLLYKPFRFSDGLKVHVLHEQYSPSYPGKYPPYFCVKNATEIESLLKGSALIDIGYFPESDWERKHVSYAHLWPYIRVDWEDSGFRKQLQEEVQPIIPLEKLLIPKGLISVACHLRRGGSFDTESTVLNAPLKFPPSSFFVSEIQELLQLFQGETLYVYLFTDDQNPIALKNEFERIFQGSPVILDCRLTKNAPNLHVLDDFFAMTQFDCSIHGESNFAFCAGKISDYLYESQASTFHWVGNQLVIDTVTRKIKKEKIDEYLRTRGHTTP